jgi:gliding motility-associated-like protein
MRTSGGCNQSFVPPCINDCDSAITECRLYIAVANVFEIDTNYIGSKYKTVWSTGQTTDTIHITQSGTYWLHTVRNDGCFQDWDTLQATIYRVPNSPMISDNHLVNVNTHPFTKPVKLCFPDTAILWGQPVNPADSIWWTGTSYTTLNYSTIQTDTTGYYTLHVRNAANCDSATTVVVEIDDFANNTLLDPHIVLADAQANASDSVRICELGTIPIYVMDSNVYVANGSTLMYDDIFWSITGANLQYDSTHNLHNNLISTIPSSGYYTISCHLKDYCAAQVDYYFSRTIYITVLPNPNPIILYPAITCPNDTIWLYTSTYATTYQWSGPSIVSVHNDSIQVLAPATDPVQYSLNVTLVDSLTNTSCSGSAYVELFPRPYPNVSLSPSDGVICPFDSVMLTCDAGINYDWISPAGLSIGSTQSINVNVPGFYHCIQTQTDGCVITSNSVEVKQYNTPFLIVEPSNTICVNESATIFVQANGNANVQWQAPLSGNALQQTITQPGTYVCHITQCGITTIDSVTISQPNTPAFIFSYSTVICPGDSLTLFGNGGMEEYNWLGQNSSDVSLVITQPGTYTLQTTDQYGCIATSAPYTINSLPQPNAPIVSDTNICGGQSITLIASASANISWFNSINTTVPFFIGDTLVTNTINNNTTYYLQTMDAVCGSSIVPVNITVSPAWITPGITGNTNLCVGDTLYLSANQSGLNYSWTQPNTQMDTLSYLQIPNVSTANAGIYTLQYNSGNCFSVVDSFTVNVNTIPIPTISQGFNFTICNGSSFVLQVDSSYTHYLWLPTNDTTQAITITNAGTYSVQVSNNGCIGTSNAVNVSFYPAVATPLVTNDTVCAGNNATLTVSGSGTFSWYDTSNVQIATGATFITPILSASQSYFVQSTDANGCTSAFVQADAILATPLPAPTITSNNTLCEGIDLQFSTALVAGATYNWSGPSGFTSSLQNPTITNVQQNNAGVYQLIVNNFGCNSAIGYDTIVINESPTMPAIVGNLVYCQEDTLLLYVSNPSSLYSYNWLNQNGTIGSNTSTLFYPFISPIDAGNFILTVTQNNCSVTDSVAVIVKPKPTATINSNYNVCVGSTLNLNTNLLNQGTYSWTGPSGFTSNNSINAITNVSQANAGVYQLVVSQDNCNSDPASVTVVVYNYPIISLGNDTSFCSGQSITYTLPSNYLYLWMNGSNANAITVSDSGLVYVAAAYGPGCITRDTVLVDDYHCLGYLPNFITPNGDGNNDYLYFDVEGAKAIDCSVFDRWGREVYRWTDLEGKWNGKSKNGTDVTAGVYYYVVYIKFVDNSESTSKGFVEVIK